MMGQPAPVALGIMVKWHKLDEPIETLLVESDQLFWECIENRLETMPGLHDLLDAIEQRGLPKCVATSGARRYAEELLSRLALRDRFAFVLTADDVTRGKPHPEIYELAANRFNVSPLAMLVLEDSANGCKAAVSAGASTVAVPSAHTAGHSYDGARLVANSLADERIIELLSG
jgi:HAD superfamily hydrolase (TIGR01509 family)